MKNGGKNMCCVYNFVQCILNISVLIDKSVVENNSHI